MYTNSVQTHAHTHTHTLCKCPHSRYSVWYSRRLGISWHPCTHTHMHTVQIPTLSCYNIIVVIKNMLNAQVQADQTLQHVSNTSPHIGVGNQHGQRQQLCTHPSLRLALVLYEDLTLLQQAQRGPAWLGRRRHKSRLVGW